MCEGEADNKPGGERRGDNLFAFNYLRAEGFVRKPADPFDSPWPGARDERPTRADGTRRLRRRVIVRPYVSESDNGTRLYYV